MDFYQGRGFGGVGGERFFDEHVLSGTEGTDCPFVVEAIRERDVDGVYGGVVEEGWEWVSILFCASVI